MQQKLIRYLDACPGRFFPKHTLSSQLPQAVLMPVVLPVSVCSQSDPPSPVPPRPYRATYFPEACPLAEHNSALARPATAEPPSSPSHAHGLLDVPVAA